MSHPTRFCYLCGDPCYGRSCKKCFRKGKSKSLAKKRARKKNYEKRR